jgi:hypothetical protein
MFAMNNRARYHGQSRLKGAASLQCPQDTLRRIVDFRAALESHDRENVLGQCVRDLRRHAQSMRELHILWPADHALRLAREAVGAPLIHTVVDAASRAERLLIHTRGTCIGHFLLLPPPSNVCVVWHINAEEAALRWERREADPIRRIVAARRLADAGWTVRFVLGPVHRYPGWQEDYRDIARRMEACKNIPLRIVRPGNDQYESSGFSFRPAMAVSKLIDGSEHVACREVPFLVDEAAGAAA